jgi:dTDP-4-dehydrorhamnose 3,5-epimerase
MQIEPTILDGCFIIEPNIFSDSRGVFFETYRKDRFSACGIEYDFVQDNQSVSKKNVLRGLHFQKSPHAQAKLVRVIRGEIWDVMVDIRPDSPTFKQWVGVSLSEHNQRMVLIGPGFAHGFYVVSDHATVVYSCSDYYAPESEGGIRWDDPELAIDWRIAPGDTALLSPKDWDWPMLSELDLPGR